MTYREPEKKKEQQRRLLDRVKCLALGHDWKLMACGVIDHRRVCDVLFMEDPLDTHHAECRRCGATHRGSALDRIAGTAIPTIECHENFRDRNLSIDEKYRLGKYARK